MTKQEILDKIDSIDCQLSPENLHCDGEISMAQARRRECVLQERRERFVKMLEKLDN